MTKHISTIEKFSKCHGAVIGVGVGQGGMGKFYICTKCRRPCDELIITQSIKDYIESEIIGEDEVEYANLDGDAGYWEKHGRNQLRNRQRTKLKGGKNT